MTGVKSEVNGNAKQETVAEEAVKSDAIKSDAKPVAELKDADAAPTAADKKISNQIRLYLNDFNLRKDDFFRSVMKKNDGAVPLDVFMECNQIRKLCQSKTDLVRALKRCLPEEISFDEATGLIRRTRDLPKFDDDYQKKLGERTVYIKRIEKKYSNLGALQEYLKKFGEVEYIQFVNKRAGKALVFFETKEAADKIKSAGDNELKLGAWKITVDTIDNYIIRKEARLTSLKDYAAVKNKIYVVKGTIPPIGEFRKKLDSISKVKFSDSHSVPNAIYITLEEAVGEEFVPKVKEMFKNNKSFSIKMLNDEDIEKYHGILHTNFSNELQSALKVWKPKLASEEEGEKRKLEDVSEAPEDSGAKKAKVDDEVPAANEKKE